MVPTFPSKTRSTADEQLLLASCDRVCLEPEVARKMNLSLAGKASKEASSVPSSPDSQLFADPLLPLSASGDSFARRLASAARGSESVLHAAGSAPEVKAVSELPRGALLVSVSSAQFKKYNELLSKQQNAQLIAAGEEPTPQRRPSSARVSGRSQPKFMLLSELAAAGGGRGSLSSRSRSRTAHNEEWTPLQPLTESHSLDRLPLVSAFS